MLRWPARDVVVPALRAWARGLAASHPDVIAVGYFGSYARGDAGVGSDLDVAVLLRESALPPERRPVAWPLEALPVPADCVALTLEEWRALAAGGSRFGRTLASETVWVFGAPPPPG